jgi:Family of unknown function (DUF6152)
VRRKLARKSFFLTLLLVVGLPVKAHHGSQGYDVNVRQTLKGIVTRFAWENPHAQIYMDVKDDKGNIVNWAIELNNPGNLVSLGWTHSSVKSGDEITVTVYPGKEGRPIGICADLLTADGRKLHSTQGCSGQQADTSYPKGQQ